MPGQWRRSRHFVRRFARAHSAPRARRRQAPTVLTWIPDTRRRRPDPGRSTRRTESPRTWPGPRSGSVRSVAMSLLGMQRHGSGPLLVWLHGFTQTKDSAHEFRSILAGTYEVLTIDLPGHGDNARISGSLEEIGELLGDALPTAPFILGGYSFGARV